jgi:hypothetical protein
MSPKIDDLSIFGEYKQKENRVTAALLQIVKAGGEPLLRYVLDRIQLPLPDSGIRIISQPANPFGDSQPDGLVQSAFSFNLFIESKLNRSLPQRQSSEHQKAVRKEDDHLLYITPHTSRPELPAGTEWTSWRVLLEALEQYTLDTTIDNYEFVSYLVMEFRKLVDHLDLISINWDGFESSDQVLILAGSWAEGIALRYGLYLCQNRRSFRPSKYLAFLNNARISHLFRIVEKPEDDVDITKDSFFDYYRNNEEPNLKAGDPRKVFKLEKCDDVLEVLNDKIDKNGNPCPFTYGQPRYTTLDKILKAKKTSEL